MGSRLCIGCGHRASEHARFCERCGLALTESARPLRAPSTLEARILEERTGIEGERKQVTVMYTDIVGSMDLTRALDAERWGFVLDRFLAIAAGAVHAYEGTVNQFTGDGLLAVFGAPLAHEDHARRACLAVLELQREVAGLAAAVARRDGATFAIRCGLNSGEVIVGAIGDDVHMDFVPIGNTTALGKRIESLAPPGSTAISAATAALVEGEFELRELGEFALKGATAPQRVLELIGTAPVRTRVAAMAATRGLSPFIGRDAESAELRSALERALAGDGSGVGIVGDPGVGKSRLVHEFAGGCAARGVTVLFTGGVAHGRYIPFLPVLALYRELFGIGEGDSASVARERIERVLLQDADTADDLPIVFEFLGVPDPDRPAGPLEPEARQRRLRAAAARTVRIRSRQEPLVLVVEDLHWLDDASALILEALAAAVGGTRTLLVCTYRPEYDAAWTGDPPHAELRLEPLAADAADVLLIGLLGQDPSLAGLAALIEARAGGNPFFIEEIVRALAENGHLSGVRGAYRLAAALDGVVLPASIEAGLAARIDRLPAREKALLQTMSVIGQTVPERLLSAVSDLGAQELTEAIEVLASGQWLVPDGAGADRDYVFRHPLTQEVAYGSQLSERRARAHRAVAAAIEQDDADLLDERAALLAHHCEAAGEDAAAAAWHARAAVWAQAASPAEGMRHWRRVRGLADELAASRERDELAARARIGILGLAWRLGMSPEEITAIHAEAEADAERPFADLFYAGSLMHSGREHEGLEGFRVVAQHALAAGDVGGALTAATGVAYASWIAGSLSESLEMMDRTLLLAGDDPTVGAGRPFVCALAHAYQSRAQALGYTGELGRAHADFDRALALAREHGDPQTESAAHANRALLDAEAGDAAAALAGAALGLALAESAGDLTHAVACSTSAAVAEGGAGRPAAALAQATANLATIRRQGVCLYYEPLLLATVARAQLALGAHGDALAAAEQGAAIAEARRLGTCALAAPLALAEVLIATQGPAAGPRVDAVLARALQVARASGARLFADKIDRLQAAEARDAGGLRQASASTAAR